MKIAYIRVSTIEQNTSRQEEALSKYDIDKTFIEKVSAKDTNRPELKKMLDFARAGDTIYIKDFSRLARSTKDLLELIEQLQEKEVSLISLNENLDTSTPTGKLLVTMIAAINEFERTNLLERQKEGIAIAKEKGKFEKADIDNDKLIKLWSDKEQGLITVKEISEIIGVSRTTIYKRIERLELEKELQEATNNLKEHTKFN